MPLKQRSFGMGIQAVIYRLLGSVPGPIVLGSLVDGSCNWWQYSCGEKKSCLDYQNQGMSTTFLWFAIVGKAISFVFFALAAYFGPADSNVVNADGHVEAFSSVDGQRRKSRKYSVALAGAYAVSSD
jgi:hypothetical protein